LNKNEACEMAQRLLRQYGQSEFEASLANVEDLKLVDEALKNLGCRTDIVGETLALKVYPKG
jgi:hypothetical protein